MRGEGGKRAGSKESKGVIPGGVPPGTYMDDAGTRDRQAPERLPLPPHTTHLELSRRPRIYQVHKLVS